MRENQWLLPTQHALQSPRHRSSQNMKKTACFMISMIQQFLLFCTIERFLLSDGWKTWRDGSIYISRCNEVIISQQTCPDPVISWWRVLSLSLWSQATHSETLAVSFSTNTHTLKPTFNSRPPHLTLLLYPPTVYSPIITNHRYLT